MSKPKIIAFDIETGGLPPEKIRKIADEFKEDAVKIGNLGLEKGLEKIAAARVTHYDRIEKTAALNAEYGKVLAIGWSDVGLEEIIATGDEGEILARFWKRIEAALVATKFKEVWVGHNCFGFDLPFLIRRSLILGVKIPSGILERGRYWAGIFIDTMEVFAAGEYKRTISLNRFCKACGLPGKTGDGANFAKLLEEDEDKALDYLRNDVEITHALASRIVPVAFPDLFLEEGKQ